MKHFLLFCLLCILSSSHTWGDAPSFASYEEPQEIVVYNRILAKVNGKTISVIDVMKKMDLFLQRYYPDHARSKYARFQYYSKQWRDTLSQIIDQELMLADAEHLELKISDSEVREEVITRFGPNIMGTLDSIGMTYEEARMQIYNEMAVNRMMWHRIHSKAFNSVHPTNIKDEYQLFCKKNPPLEKWRYQVLSIRSAQSDIGKVLAQRAFELLETKRFELATLPTELKSEEESTSVSLSPELEGDEKNLSDSHKEVLRKLSPGSFSAPISQVSRADNSTVFRIFYLIEQQKHEPPAFAQMADELKEKLLEHAIAKQSATYIAKLRDRLGYDEKHMLEVLPEDFQPFVLR